jgi:hypothetical protein
MNQQQNIQSNLAAGFQNNVHTNPQIQSKYRQPQVNLNTVPPEVLNSIKTQLLDQMQQGQGQMQNNIPVNNPDTGVGVRVDDAYSLLGFSLQRKYVYIIGCILLLGVGYYLWKWYNSKPIDEDDESEYEDDDDDDMEFDGMLGYPNTNNQQDQQNRLMQQQLMQQQLMQQQMMQRKLAEQQQKNDKSDEE